MLTLHEIEDSYELHFRHQVEDLSDEALGALLVDGEALRRRLPPSLPMTEAKAIVAALLTQRNAARPDVAPEGATASEQAAAARPQTARPATAAGRSLGLASWTLPWRMMAAALKS